MPFNKRRKHGRAVGSFFMVVGRERWVKISAIMVGRRQKILKKSTG